MVIQTQKFESSSSTLSTNLDPCCVVAQWSHHSLSYKREKVGHHELQAARVEEERRLLQGQMWQQRLEFREVHQQKLGELRNFQSSTFDTLARRKLIEDQSNVSELSALYNQWSLHLCGEFS